MSHKSAVKKQNLEKLLDLIPLILRHPDNDWFRSRLIDILSKGKLEDEGILNPTDVLHSYSEKGKVYIIIDPSVLIIDYSDIPDEKVRNQLNVDCYEMARHRSGRANHEQSYDEFCRYAHMQIEELVNYYFAKSFNNDIDRIVTFIEQYSKFQKTSNRVFVDVKQIDFTFKLFALRDSKSINFESQEFDLIYSLKDLRNKMSHRSTLTQVDEDKVLNTWHEKRPLSDEEKKELKIIKFRRGQNYDNVYLLLKNLKDRIVKKLS